MLIRAYGSRSLRISTIQSSRARWALSCAVTERLESTEGYYHVIFQACLRHSYEPSAWKVGTGIFLLKHGKESYFEAKSFRIIASTSFKLKWLEKLILYHINEDHNVQAKLSASQYVFCAGVSTETALHKFVRRVEQRWSRGHKA